MPYLCKHKQAEAGRKHYLANKAKVIERSRLKTVEARKRNKEFIKIYLENNPCVDCGEKNTIVLEFDHLREKKMDISKMVISGYGLESIKLEIAKCEVRCANCHRIVTYNRRENEKCKK